MRESKGYVCPLGQICTVRVGFSIVFANGTRKFGNGMNG